MKMIALMMALTLAAPLALTGCDRTVETQTKETSGPNGSSVEKKTVTEHNDGTVTETKEKSSSSGTTSNP